MTNAASGAGSAPATTKAPEAQKTAEKVEVTSGKQLAESVAAKSASQDDKPTQQNSDKTTEGTNPASHDAQNGQAPSPDGPATVVSERRVDGIKKFELFARTLREAGTPESHVLFGLNGVPFTVGDFKDVWREIA